MHFASRRLKSWALVVVAVLTASAVISATSPGEALRTGNTTDDRLINTTTAGAQNAAAVARDAVGNYVVVWSGNGGTGANADSTGVFFQRYDHNGVPIGAETKANTNTLGTQQNPAVAMTPTGEFVVAWETCQTANVCDISMQLFANDGSLSGVETMVNTTTCGDQSRPVVAMAPTGDFVVAWQGDESDSDGLPVPCADQVDPTGYDIFARQYNAQGVALAGEIAVNATTGFAQKDPKVAMDVDGDFVIVFQSLISGSGQDILARPFASDGTPGTEFRANATTAGDQTLPGVGMAADGSFDIVWQGPDAAGNGIFLRRYNAAAVQQSGSDQAVNTTTAGEQTSPAVAVDALGDIVVAWQQGSPGDIYFQRFNAAGVGQGAESPANKTTANDQAFPAIAADADGDFVIAWESIDAAATYGIYLRRFSGPQDVDLVLTKTDSADPVGRNVDYSYTIVVHNNATVFTGSGDATIDGAVRTATGVTVTDTLPAGVTFVSVDGGTNWSNCTNSGSTVSCTYTQAILPGADADDLTVTVHSPLTDQLVVNSATVAGDQYDSTVPNSTGTQDTWVCNGATSGALQFSATSYTVGEDGDDAGGNDDGKLTVTVSRTGSSCGDATVQLSAHSTQIGTSPNIKQPAGTATVTANADYTGVTAQTLTLPNGVGSTTFDVSIADDALNESNETFNLQLQNATRATLDTSATSTKDTARVTINDNDVMPTATLSVAGSPLSESGGIATLTATLNAASGRAVTIGLAITAGSATNARYGVGCVSGSATGETTTGDNDYNCSATSISIPAGSLTGNVTFTGVSDARDEVDKEPVQYAPACTNCTLSGAAPVIEVADDDAAPTVQFLAASSSVAEDTTDGIPATNHNNSDTIAVQLTGNVTDRAVTVAFAYDPDAPHNPAKATPGTDFSVTPATSPLTFNPHTPGVNGVTSQNIVLTTVIDQTHENNELAAVTLSGPTNATLGANATHTTTITDNDAVPTASFVPNTAQVTEGNTGSQDVIVTVGLSAASGTGVSVPFGIGTGTPNATNPADHNATAGTISIPAGQTSGTYTYQVFGDTLDEGDGDGTSDEKVVLTMGTPTGATQGANTTHTTTIVDDDAKVTATIDTADPGYTATKSETGGTVSLVVKLNTASGRTVTVPFTTNSGQAGAATSGSDYTLSPATQVVFNAGETSKTITITLIDDTADEANSEPLTLTLGNPTNGQISPAGCSPANSGCQYTLSITDDDDVPQVNFTAAASSANEDAAGTRKATVHLSRTTSSDLTIPITVGTEAGHADSPADYTLLCPNGAGGTQPCNGEIIIAQGTQNGDITINVVGDKNDEGNETVTLTLGTGSGYTLQAPTTHVHTITDDDTAGITLVQSSGSTNVAEGSATTDSYTLVLTSQPTANVVIDISATQVLLSTAASPTPAATKQVTFTTANWNVAQTVTVSAIDDAVAETNPHTGTISHSVSSVDQDYSGRAVPDVTVNVSDNDSPGIQLIESGGSTNVTEGGATDSYTIVLSSQPTADVVIDLGANQVLLSTAAQPTPGSTAQLTFTNANWNVAQTVTVTADDDDVAEGTHAGLVMHTVSSADATYDNRALRDVTPTITDNDTASVTLTESGGSTDVTEGGATDSYTLVLTSQPTADVTIDLSVGSQATVNPPSVTFNSVNWNMAVAVTVTAVNDDVAEGNHSDLVTHTASSADPVYDGIAVADVDVNITDNETVGITLTQSGGSTNVAEGGATDSYTLVLTSQPSADVTITLTDDADVDASPASLTFTNANWNVPKTVTVTAVDDAQAEGNHTGTITHAVSSADTAYNSQTVPDVTANITDNETAGVSVVESGGSTTVTEGGATDTYTIVLTSQPTADVVVTLSTGSQITAGPASVTFTSLNWFMAQSVTVTAVDDAIAEGNHGDGVSHVAASSDPDYNGIAVAPVSVAITDNDSAGVSVTQSGGSTTVSESGTTDTYTVVLTSQPTADVTVTVTGDANVSGAPGTLTFTNANWFTAQTVTVTAVDDAIAEGTHAGTVTNATSSADPGYNGIATASVTATITDNDTAGIVVTQSGGSTAVSEAGTTDSYTIVLTSQPTASVTISVTGDAQVTGSPGSLVFTTANWNVPHLVTVSAVNDAVAEGNHSGTLTHAASSSDATYNGMSVASVTASITDNDTAGVIITQSGGSTAVTEGGTTDSYTAVLRSQPTANVTVSINPGNQLTASPMSLSFTPSNWNVAQTVTVNAINDVSAEGTQSVSITHTASSGDTGYSGIAVPSVSVTITDNDVAGIIVTESGGTTAVSEAGGSDTVTVQLATQPNANVTITADPGSQLTVTPTTLTFTPANYATPQTVTIRAVDDGQVEGTATTSLGGTSSSADANYNGPLGNITVTVTDNDSVNAGENAPVVVVTATGGSVSVSANNGSGGGALPVSSLLALFGLGALRRRRGLRVLLAGLLGAAALLPGSAGAADEASAKFGYRYADLRYVSANAKDADVGASGFSLAGSMMFQRDFFGVASLSRASTDDFTVQGAKGSVTSTTLSLGGGMRRALNPKIDATGTLSLVYSKADAEGGFAGSSNDTGFALDAGLRGWFTPKAEWGVGLDYLSIFNDSDTSFNAQALYHVNPQWGLALGTGFSSSSTQFNLGARYSF